MNDSKRCALLDIPISSPYRDYGLDLSQEAIEGPKRPSYPFGAKLHITVDRRVVQTNNNSRVYYVHNVHVTGPWQHIEAVCSRGGFFQKVSMLFGRAPL